MSYQNNGSYEDEAEQFRKVFVGGLDIKTTNDGLKSYFEKYGEIVDHVVVTHPGTKRPRGFGFVTFQNSSSVDKVQKERPHTVEGRIVETKRAMPKEDDGKPESKAKVSKMFVAGVKDEIEESHLRECFTEYGKITNVNIVTERGSGKKRGFAFIEFDDYDPVDKAVLKRSHHIGGCKLDVKKALSKQQMEEANTRKNSGGGGYGGGGGYSGGSQRYGGGGGGDYGYNDGYGNSNYGGQQDGGWHMDSGYDDQGMGGNYSDFGYGYDNSYNSGPMRGGNQFNQRSKGPYGGSGGRGGGRGRGSFRGGY